MRRTFRSVLLTTLVLGSLAGCSAPQQPQTQEPEVIGVRVTYMPKNPNVVGYLARPKTQGKHPTLILIHEWWGLNDNIRTLADDFAKQGYVALAVDLYAGKTATTPEQAKALATSVRENTKDAFDNLKAAVAYVGGSPSADTSRMAAVGWCFGGGWSYQMAKNDLGVKASVMYYGQFAPEDDLQMMKAHILGHFAEDDTVIAVDNVKEFEAKLKTHSGEHQVFIYPNNGHGFANENSDNYDPQAAQQAWARTLDFLAKQLK